MSTIEPIDNPAFNSKDLEKNEVATKKPTKDSEDKDLSQSLIGVSSFHGVIQAYLHRNIFNRLSWSICLLICITGFAVHFWSLLDRYLGLPTTIDMISTVNYDPFPAVTICPQTALSTSKYGAIAYTKRPEIDNATMSLLYSREMLNKWKEVYSGLGEDITDPRIVGRYWDKSVQSIYRIQNVLNYSLGRRHYETILYCEINGKKCTFRNFQEIDHFRYNRCFMFKSPYQNEIPEQLVIIITHADDKKRSTEDIDTITSQIGAHVTLNEQGFYPGTSKSFQSAPDDSQTEIRIRQEGLNKVNKQRSPCLKDKNLYRGVYNNLEYNNSFNEVINYKHDLIMCRYFHLQKEFVDKCGCINSDYPNFVEPIKDRKDIKFCDYMLPKTNVSIIIKNFQCINNVFENETFIKSLSKICFSSCDQTIYSTASFNMPWFDKTLNDEAIFMEDKVNKHLEDIKDIVDVTKSKPIIRMNSCIRSSTYRKCFTLLNFVFESSRKEIIREYEAYLLRNFFSDLGGIMGLWVGVSLVTIVEIVQVIIKVSKENSKRTVRSIKKKSLKKASMKNKNNNDNNNNSNDNDGIPNETYENDR